MSTLDARRTSSHDSGVAELVDDAGLGDGPLVVPQHAPVGEHIRAGLDTRLRALVAHDPGTRLGDDPEELHQMRVAIRRMRAMLRSGRSFLDNDWSEPLRAELGWLGRSLGPVRDLDVLLAELRDESAEFGSDERAAAEHLIDGLRDEHARARADLLDALDSSRYRNLLAGLADAVREPLPTSDSGVDSRTALHELIGSQYRKLRKDVKRATPEPADAQLHALRIRGKRLRYTAELGAELFGKRTSKLLKAAKQFQDVLGQHQDACVADERVRGLLENLGGSASPDVTFVAGRLVERQAVRRHEARVQWWPRWLELRERAEKLTAAPM